MKKLCLLTVLLISITTLRAQESARFLIDTVYFDFDRHTLKEEYKAELDSLIKLFVDYPSYYVEIFGHTDSIGSDAYNLQLSELRARAVSLHLVESGVNLERITYEGLGTTKPVGSNITFAGRIRNRRADVAVVFSREVYEPPVVESDTGQDTVPVVEIDPASITDTIFCDYNPFPFNPARRNFIVAPEGTKIIIPPNAFNTESPELMAELDELFYRSDMIYNEMTTMSKDGPLETAGMFNLSVTDRGRGARMQEGVTIEAQVPTTRRDKDMAVYQGSGGRGGARKGGRKINPDDGNIPLIGPSKSWTEIRDNLVSYDGPRKVYTFEIPKPGKYSVSRPLYYPENTERKDNGIDIRVKFKGKRFERNTTAMIVGEVVKTYIPLRKKDTRNYEARRVKFMDEKTPYILIGIQYDRKGIPWLVKRSFTVGSLVKKPKKKKKNRYPVIKLKAKFRQMTPDRLDELLKELNV